MFDFTTTTFIHDADMIEANPGSTSNFLRIGNATFKYEEVAAIYRNPYVAPANAKLKIDINNFMTKAKADPYNGKRFKLDFYLRRTGDNNAYYSNDFVFKGKDFHYEWTNKQDTAEKLAKHINKIIRLYGDVYLKVYAEENGILVFENDNYGRFTEAMLSVYEPQESDCCTFREGGWAVLDVLDGPTHYCGEYTCEESMLPYVTSKDNEDYYDKSTGMGGWITAWQGVNGFGTYEQLLKDLRLPTMENMRWTSLNETEMPIPGTKYVQYTIHQIACRGVLGGSAVGEVTHSKTTHVYFVPACGCDTDLDQLLKQAIKDAGMEALLLTTTESRAGVNVKGKGDEAPGTEGEAIITDKVTDPARVENFVRDASIKAITTNNDEHPHNSNESGTDEPSEPSEPTPDPTEP